MIIYHYFDAEFALPIVPTKHGNTKKQDTQDSRPKEHFIKRECKEAVQGCNNAFYQTRMDTSMTPSVQVQLTLDRVVYRRDSEGCRAIFCTSG